MEGFGEVRVREAFDYFPAHFSIVPFCNAAKKPKTLEDVKRESKRMMDEWDGLLVRLNQQQGMDGPTKWQGYNTVDKEDSGDVDGEVL